MISVSSDFKNAVKQPTKQIKGYIVSVETYPDEITESDDLQDFTLKVETSLAKTVMRYGEANFFGSHDYLGKYVNLGLGVVLPNTTTEYIDYGSFLVTSIEENIGSTTTKIKYFDKMYESLQSWDLDPIYDRTYPCTLKELLEAICDRFSWTLDTATFPNDGTSVTADFFTDAVTTYRDVLEFIAEASGCLIYFDVNNHLVVKEIAKTGSVETITTAMNKTLKLQTKYGEINSVVLSRQPQEDNILEKDQTSIDANGLTEIKFKNNLLVDSDRTTWITEIFDTLFELEFYPFDASTIGLGYLQTGDRITVVDRSSVSYETVVLGVEISLSAGFSERLFAKIPDKNSTNYNTAGIIGQNIRNTQIIVDKQNGIITLINADIGDLQGDITTLTQLVDSLTISVEGIGGTNLIKNSVGLKGDIKDWQTLDSGGVPTDSRNNGTIVQTTDVQLNSESHSAIQLANQFIHQTVNTIVGETYTIFLRFNRTNALTLSVTGQADQVVTVDGYTTATWSTYKFQFVASSGSTTIQLNNGSGATALISDTICKLGDANGWMQAPNEVYGSNYRFDKEGFSITSLTDYFKSVLDNTKLAVYDTSTGSDKIVMYVSKDSGRILKLTAQDRFAIQRYENEANSLIFIPTSRGAILTVNS